MVHITNSYSPTIGGAERIVRYLHSHSLKSGVNSKVIGLYHNNLEQDNLPEAHTLGRNSPYRLKTVWALFKALKPYNQPSQLIHAHLFPTILYLAIFKRLGLIRARIVVTEHSTSNNRRNKWYGVALDRFIFRSYAKVFAISEGVAQSLRQRSVVKEGSLAVIPNGTELAFSKPLKRSTPARVHIISVGSLRPAKNYSHAIKALSTLKDLKWHYSIAGEGELEAELKTLIAEEGLVDRVRLLGRQDPIDHFLKEGDLFLMPSAWEGFGLAAVEAMNASLPLIVSNVPGLKELVRVNQHTVPFARLVNPKDISEIACALREVLVNIEKYRSFAQQAFEHSLAYSSQIMAKRYLKYYLNLSRIVK